MRCGTKANSIPIFDGHAEMRKGLSNPRVYRSTDSNNSEIAPYFSVTPALGKYWSAPLL
jgi:hypothetical protein